MSPVERRREADDAAHQARPHMGLQGGAYADTRREREGLQDREHVGGIKGGPDIDQKRPQDDPGPYPRTVHQECGQGNASGRPDRRRIPWGDGQEQGEPARSPVGRGDDTHRNDVRAMGSPGDVDMHAGSFYFILGASSQRLAALDPCAVPGATLWRHTIELGWLIPCTQASRETSRVNRTG